MSNKLKTVGMVTLYDDNFGTCLQAFALFTAIQELGYKPEIIRYSWGNTSVENTTGLARVFSRLKGKDIKTILNYLHNKSKILNRKNGFAEFKKHHFTFSVDSYNRDSDLSALSRCYDAFVCGSDMIWSDEFIEDWDFFYLNFVKSNNKVAFSPSFGKNIMVEANMKKSKSLIEKIPENQRSCRDETGVATIRERFGLNAFHTIDPTMLFDKKHWSAVISSEGRIVEEPYTLTYAFGGLGKPRNKIFEQVESWHLGQTKTLCDFTDKNSISSIVNDPLAFLRAFRDAEFIMTDTFHGLIFSLLFEKPFVCMEREDGGHWAKYSDRMTSTLKMLGLEERYVNSNTMLPEKLRTMDYTKVNSILEVKRKQSWDFLRKALVDATKVEA